jgi:membrane fusion protein (multidrug efflux system)
MLFVCVVVPSLAFTNCGDDEQKVETKSLEQIYEDEGVPVRIIDVTDGAISNQVKFIATMSGIQETTISAKIADKIVTLPVRVGQSVKEGQIVATFPTDNVSVQWNQAKASLDNAQKTYERMKNLLASGDIAQSNFDGAETQYLVAKQTFDNLKQMVYLDAPFDGIITSIPSKVGDKVNPGAPIVTVAKTGTMIARIWASETEVGELKIGMPAQVTINDQTFTGKIADIALSMDQARRAFQVDVHFANPKGLIKSGTVVDVVFNFGNSTRQAIVIPRRVMQTNGDEQFVFVADNGVAKKVPIKISNALGTSVVVEEGLKPEDKVISEGTSLLDDGDKIKIITTKE